MSLQPERASSDGRIDAGLFPPCGFIATAMDLAGMAPAQRHGELIADLAAECWRLRKAQVMRIGGAAAADQAGMFGNRFDVLSIANAAWRRQRQDSFIETRSLP